MNSSHPTVTRGSHSNIFDAASTVDLSQRYGGRLCVKGVAQTADTNDESTKHFHRNAAPMAALTEWSGRRWRLLVISSLQKPRTSATVSATTTHTRQHRVCIIRYCALASPGTAGNPWTTSPP
mmetsp:Transcript_5676/g.13739  ORF Transcript_5676/g.13739 Transcript_5676/m.13739 type:complete len:123 (-) Transcript_5676:876-1244(-)